VNTWRSVELGDQREVYGKTLAIEKLFTPLFAVAGCPGEMAVFYRYDRYRNIETAYFSPAAHEVAKRFNATPCEKPSRELLRLILGDDGCELLLFGAAK